MSLFAERQFNRSKMTKEEARGYYFRLFSLVCWDLIMIPLASIFALVVRFDLVFSKVEPVFWENLVKYMVINIVITLILFSLFHLYSSLWRFASIIEGCYIVGACVCSSICHLVGISILGMYLPRSYYIFYPCTLIVFTVIGRFSYRFIRIYRSRVNKEKKDKTNVMIIGAGAAGQVLLHELKESRFLNYDIKCIIDDDPHKAGNLLNGVPIAGGRELIALCVDKYDIEEIIFAIPNISEQERRKILNICAETSCHLKTIPGIYQLVNNEVTVNQIREVEIEDLLGRDPVNVDLSSVLSYVKEQVVLVTGGGGSIGSEICRQIAKHHPKQLIIVDNYENNAYELQMELNRKMPELNLIVLIASVQNHFRIERIFDEYQPDLVFHAAAHKHVPLMEVSPCESIKNNVIGTYHVAMEAHRHQVKRMVLISTDKAVRPTNIMGASKRICEMIIQSFNNRSETTYAAVRFGNVLGSNGSVIPLFKEQIKNGGPVTVTHKDIIRYFMTIPEAVSLVLQAGAYAKGGEIFILDMGEPVKILDLAENLIRLSGYVPGEDIKIKFTGLRPGEKLYEELLIDDENKRETSNKRIFIGQPPAFDEEAFWQKLAALKVSAMAESPDIKEMVKEIVPEFTYKE